MTDPQSIDKGNRFERFLGRYQEGKVPWDDPVPPPEIIALASELSPGRGLDLGCGYGRSAIYLAELGWSMDGVDFVPQAVETARHRASAAGVAGRARFYQGSVTDLAFLNPPYDLAIDVGCMHSLTGNALLAYRDGLVRLLRPDGQYTLFAHLRADDDPDEDARGIPERILMQLMEGYFRLDKVEHGVTQVADGPVWTSGWFWFSRQ